MRQYRFITPHRKGKWYKRLFQAQRHAERIGAGFLDAAGRFVAYRGTVLEIAADPAASAKAAPSADDNPG